jgi:hypothetical protein
MCCRHGTLPNDQSLATHTAALFGKQVAIEYQRDFCDNRSEYDL